MVRNPKMGRETLFIEHFFIEFSCFT
jgi:hypothetical protein